MTFPVQVRFCTKYSAIQTTAKRKRRRVSHGVFSFCFIYNFREFRTCHIQCRPPHRADEWIPHFGNRPGICVSSASHTDRLRPNEPYLQQTAGSHKHVPLPFFIRPLEYGVQTAARIGLCCIQQFFLPVTRKQFSSFPVNMYAQHSTLVVCTIFTNFLGTRA